MVVVRHTGHAIQVISVMVGGTLPHSSHFHQVFLCFKIFRTFDIPILQEDVPDEFATLIVNFISRNRIGPHGVEVGISVLFISCHNQ